jgi:hypothetical protein
MSVNGFTNLLCPRYLRLRLQSQGEWLRDSRWPRRHTLSRSFGVIDLLWVLYSTLLPTLANREKEIERHILVLKKSQSLSSHEDIAPQDELLLATRGGGLPSNQDRRLYKINYCLTTTDAELPVTFLGRCIIQDLWRSRASKTGQD